MLNWSKYYCSASRNRWDLKTNQYIYLFTLFTLKLWIRLNMYFLSFSRVKISTRISWSSRQCIAFGWARCNFEMPHPKKLFRWPCQCFGNLKENRVHLHSSYKWFIMPEKCGHPDLTVFHLIWIIGTCGNWKNQIMGAVLELPAKLHCQFSPFGSLHVVNGLDWQCYLAGSSKTAPRILIFSMAMGAKPSF